MIKLTISWLVGAIYQLGLNYARFGDEKDNSSMYLFNISENNIKKIILYSFY